MPLLVGRGECRYDFEWHTAAACVQHDQQGEDCRVYDHQQGADTCSLVTVRLYVFGEFSIDIFVWVGI